MDILLRKKRPHEYFKADASRKTILEYVRWTQSIMPLCNKCILIITMTIDVTNCFAHATFKTACSTHVRSNTRGDATNIGSFFNT